MAQSSTASAKPDAVAAAESFVIPLVIKVNEKSNVFMMNMYKVD